MGYWLSPVPPVRFERLDPPVWFHPVPVTQFLDGTVLFMKAMELQRMDRVAEIYGKLPLKELKLHNFLAPTSLEKNGLAALLPGITSLFQAVKED